MKGFSNLKEVMAYFSDEKVCLSYLEEQLWNGKPVCPHCGCTKVWRLADGKNFKCGNKKGCDSRFNVLVGTMYENTKLPLSTWFGAMYLCTSHKKGVSSYQIARDFGITQKSAWFLLHRIREMTKLQGFKAQFVAQADEVFIGGRNKNKHAHKKNAGSGGATGKTPVLGVMQENGVVKTEVLPNTQEETMKPLIKKMVEERAILITDDLSTYDSLNEDYFHVVVSHIYGEYVRGAFSTNRLEGFWSLLKRSIFGIYHCVSPKHLHRYCDENAHRYNLRKMSDPARFALTVRSGRGRLKYADLIKCTTFEEWQKQQKKGRKRLPPESSLLSSI